MDLSHFKIFGTKGIIASDKATTIPICSSCVIGGMQRRPIPGNTHTQTDKNRGVLKRNNLAPGDRIFSDQFVSSVPGKNFNGRGQQSANHSYKGGTIFGDAATGYLSIKHQLGFTASETITSLLAFERESTEVGVHIKGYNTDNGVYVAKEIIKKLHNSNQTLSLSGIGAHHQNGVAENAIKNISRRARIAMFHAALRWPNKFDKHLWPLAMNNAVHIHNHTPRKTENLLLWNCGLDMLVIILS